MRRTKKNKPNKKRQSRKNIILIGGDKSKQFLSPEMKKLYYKIFELFNLPYINNNIFDETTPKEIETKIKEYYNINIKPYYPSQITEYNNLINAIHNEYNKNNLNKKTGFVETLNSNKYNIYIENVGNNVGEDSCPKILQTDKIIKKHLYNVVNNKEKTTKDNFKSNIYKENIKNIKNIKNMKNRDDTVVNEDPIVVNKSLTVIKTDPIVIKEDPIIVNEDVLNDDFFIINENTVKIEEKPILGKNNDKSKTSILLKGIQRFNFIEKYIVTNVPSDGNCFYRAMILALQSKGYYNTVEELRRFIFNNIDKHLNSLKNKGGLNYEMIEKVSNELLLEIELLEKSDHSLYFFYIIEKEFNEWCKFREDSDNEINKNGWKLDIRESFVPPNEFEYCKSYNEKKKMTIEDFTNNFNKLTKNVKGEIPKIMIESKRRLIEIQTEIVNNKEKRTQLIEDKKDELRENSQLFPIPRNNILSPTKYAGEFEIAILQNFTNYRFIVFKINEQDNMTITPPSGFVDLVNDNSKKVDKKTKYIMLYLKDLHYGLISLNKNGKYESIFEYENIPKEIINFFKV